MHAPEPIITLAQGHIAILIGRNWPAIVELLDESEEVTVSAKIVITERTPEAGEHSDVDHRVKTTISFSKKVSDSTESALEDPSANPLKCPHGKMLDEFCQECANEAKAGNVFAPQPRNVPVVGDGSDVCDHGVSLLERCAECDGRKAERGIPIGTPVGAALDAAAVKTKAPQFALDLVRAAAGTWTSAELIKQFREAAKKAGWTPPQISALADVLKKADTVAAMIETLRPFVIAEEPTSAEMIEIPTHGNMSIRVPRLAIELPDGFPLASTVGVFRSAAQNAQWPLDAIGIAVSEAERQARVIGDEPEATETAVRYLRNFCVSK